MAEFNHNPSVKRKKPRMSGASNAISKKNRLNERIVEKILDRRCVNGRTELLMKWKNLPMDQCTWESAEKLGSENVYSATEVNYDCQRLNSKPSNNGAKPTKKKQKQQQQQSSKAAQNTGFKSSPSSDGNTSDSSSSSDSTNETSSSDEEPEELQDKPQMTHMNSYNNMQSAYGMPNSYKPNETKSMPNYGLGHVRDLLSSDDDSEPENQVPKIPDIPPNPTLESLKMQAKSWLQMKTAMLSSKQHESSSGSSSHRRKSAHASNARESVNVEQIPQQMPPDMNHCGNMDRSEKNVVQQQQQQLQQQLQQQQQQQQQQYEQKEEPKKVEEEDENAEGAEEAQISDFGRWDESLTVPTHAYGIDMGLVLEKVLKSFKIRGETYLVAKWRNRTTPDAVKMKKLVALYPHLVIEYFEKLEMRTVD
ncbi:hypothetical protein KR093_005701 [Drosophila rubida]|uniref:Chromo domain-containing protein n=1 Tax=Drosophila rubida TaxID=30044 RepID=A0AAD4PLA6_9MUSC|nr:hypothetical protein KR093_005701 [Drosophila rubida]